MSQFFVESNTSPSRSMTHSKLEKALLRTSAETFAQFFGVRPWNFAWVCYGSWCKSWSTRFFQLLNFLPFFGGQGIVSIRPRKTGNIRLSFSQFFASEPPPHILRKSPTMFRDKTWLMDAWIFMLMSKTDGKRHLRTLIKWFAPSPRHGVSLRSWRCAQLYCRLVRNFGWTSVFLLFFTLLRGSEWMTVTPKKVGPRKNGEIC